MKKLTKYDVADLVLVYVALTFLLTLAASLVAIGSSFGIRENEYTNRDATIMAQFVYFAALCVINYILFCKRSALIRLIFPHSEETEIELGDGLTALTRYSFWIRLQAIISLLAFALQFFRHLASVALSKRPFDIESYEWMQVIIGIALIMACLLILRKADWIADKLKNLGSSNRSPTPLN